MTWLRDVVLGLAVGAVASCIALLVQLDAADAHLARERDFVRELKADFAKHCKVDPADWSATCEPGTFAPELAK